MTVWCGSRMKMDKRNYWSFVLLFSVLLPLLTAAWRSSIEDDVHERRDMRRVHYHTKRHMLPGTDAPAPREKRRSTTSKPRERDLRKKPSGHLTPLEEDDMENDEVVSVAIGPPPIRPKYEKLHKKNAPKKVAGYNNNTSPNTAASNLVKDVLSQLGREFLTKEVNENFIFGQYVGNSMKNLTNELRIDLQHEILELIVKYQKKNLGDRPEKDILMTTKETKLEKKFTSTNETDESWPDFTNLEKIVG